MRTQPLTLIGVLLLVTGLIAHGIPADPIWYDEHRSYYYAGWDAPGALPLTETLARVRESDVQAPGYFTLLNVWGRLAGQMPFTGRVLSLYAAVMAVAVVYRLGCDLGTRRVGLAAALTLGTSGFFVVYGHETRTYALLCLSIALALLSYHRLQRGGGVTAGALFVMSLAALPYLHYLAALLFPVLGLYHLLTFENGRRWWTITGLAALAALLFTPWGAVALQAARERASRFVWLTGAAMLLLVFAFDQFIPVLNHSRYLIVLWAFVALLVGFGAEQLARLGVPLALILGVWGAFGVARALDDDYRRTINGPGAYAAWDFAGAFLRERVAEDDLIALHLPFDTRYGKFHQPIADYYLHGLEIDATGIESRRLQPDADYVRVGLSRVQDAERVWYLRELANVPERYGVFDRAIGETLAHCGAILDNDAYKLDLYIAPPQPDDVALTFGEGIGFVPAFSPDDAHGAHLTVTSGWQIDDSVPPHTYSVALHLLDTDGALVAQADYGLPGVGAHCGYGELDLSPLPPGDYQLTLSVYAWETGERLLAGEDAAERVPLGWIDWGG